MKFLRWVKDGGPESRVWGFFVVEMKSLFSIVVLKFEHGSRESYHSHAFNSVSWLVRGELHEQLVAELGYALYKPSVLPIVTKRSTFHKVFSVGTSWVVSFRGPWVQRWYENLNGRKITLTHGRQEVV